MSNNDFDDEIRDAASQAAVEVLDEVGNDYLYTNRGGPQGVIIKANRGNSTKHAATMLACRVEITQRVFNIPYQPCAIGPQGPQGPQGFPAHGNDVDDFSEYDTIQKWDCNGAQGIGPVFYFVNGTYDSVDAMFSINTEAYQPTRIGIDS